MATLFQTPQEIASTTIMGGNVDGDRYRFIISEVQDSVIRPLLGTELNDLIYDGATAGNLTGLYLELYTDYVKPITKNEAVAQYIEVANLRVANGGIFTHNTEAGTSALPRQIEVLANRYHSLTDSYIERFNKWIGLNNILEYKTSQNGVNAQDVSRSIGWYLED